MGVLGDLHPDNGGVTSGSASAASRPTFWGSSAFIPKTGSSPRAWGSIQPPKKAVFWGGDQGRIREFCGASPWPKSQPQAVQPRVLGDSEGLGGQDLRNVFWGLELWVLGLRSHGLRGVSFEGEGVGAVGLWIEGFRVLRGFWGDFGVPGCAGPRGRSRGSAESDVGPRRCLGPCPGPLCSASPPGWSP